MKIQRTPKDHTQDGAIAYVYSACEYIKNNFQNCISVTDVASHVAIDRTYLFKLFRSIKGITPSRYIQLIRLEHAKKLIEQGTTPLSEVPVQSGFRTRSRFSEIFKAEYGVTPKEYARNTAKSKPKR